MGGMSSLANLGLNMALGQQAVSREGRRLRKERDRQLQSVAQADAEAERRQQDALRRRVAGERARAGAAGTATSGGSIDAILRGLEREAEDEAAARQRESAARMAQIRDTFATRRDRSLLDFNSRLLSSALGRSGSSAIGRSLLG